MRSPKFNFSKTKIEGVVSQSALKKTWKSLGGQLRKQLFLDLIEFKDYDQRIDTVTARIEKEVHEASYRPDKPIHYLVEKSRGLCRQMTQCRPEDLLILETLTRSLKAELVDGRPSKKAFFEPDDQRFARSGPRLGVQEYSAIASWKNFQQEIFRFSKERKYIVVTDVANFYDFISFTHLRNIISSICNVREEVLDFLVFVLNEMAWTPDYMPRSEIGLPQMESNAPRVLANAMLYELDRVAEGMAFGDYVRFMDDIDVGLDSISTAKRVIRDIDLTLQSRQLRLNSSKTKILRASQAFDHFCIRENRFLDTCVQILELDNPNSKTSVKKAIGKAYTIWKGDDLQDSRFTRGNGDKIFKYMAKVGRAVEYEIFSDDLVSMIKLQPGMRLTAFSLLSFKDHPNQEFYILCDFFEDGIFVDDFSCILMAKFAVHARFRANSKMRKSAKMLIDRFCETGTIYSIYSALLVASKFLSPVEQVGVLQNTYDCWRGSFWLGRTVGGLTPNCATDVPSAEDYIKLLQKAENPMAQEVYDFHRQIQTQKSYALRLYSYAKAPNPTYPQRIIHPKALIIRSMSQNSEFNAEMKEITKVHQAFTADPFYRDWSIK
ncbi:MAG: RNA-directed DNA polymerase [Cyanobacteria bacterium P01_F01_bin.53]